MGNSVYTGIDFTITGFVVCLLICIVTYLCGSWYIRQSDPGVPYASRHEKQESTEEWTEDQL